MKQNIYDTPEFFEGYMNLRKGEQGLNGVLEQPTLRSLLPNLQGLRILDLGCGFGGFAAYALERGASSFVGVDMEPAPEAEHVRQRPDLLHERRRPPFLVVSAEKVS